MMLLVTYDLKMQRDYTLFYSALQQQGDWWHYLASTWLLNTQRTPTEVSQAVRPLMGDTDFLLIVEITRNYQGWLPKEAWDWINSRMSHAVPVPPFLRFVPPPPGGSVDYTKR